MIGDVGRWKSFSFSQIKKEKSFSFSQIPLVIIYALTAEAVGIEEFENPAGGVRVIGQSRSAVCLEVPHGTPLSSI